MSEIRVPACLGYGEDSLPGLQKATFLLCPHMARGKERRGWVCEGGEIEKHQATSLSGVSNKDINSIIRAPPP